MKSDKNVIVFGESGSGKSSLINLMLGQNKANVSDKAVGCTFNFQRYETPNLNLYDTAGLSEGANGTIKQEFAVKELISLLQSLKEGVSLLIFVIEKGRIKKSLHKNYKLFVEAICLKSVPVVLVITHCEMEYVPGRWWQDNKEHFEKYGMKFDAVVTGCALNPSNAPELMRERIKEMNDQTVEQLLIAISAQMLRNAWRVEGGWNSWLYTILKGVVVILGKMFNFSSLLPTTEVADYKLRLIEFFHSYGYDNDRSTEMAQHMSDELKSADPKKIEN